MTEVSDTDMSASNEGFVMITGVHGDASAFDDTPGPLPPPPIQQNSRAPQSQREVNRGA